MSKKIFAIFLIISILLQTMIIKVDAKDIATISITPNKTSAKVGETVEYSISISNVTNLQGIEFELVIPEYLTYVENSYVVTDNLTKILGSALSDFTQSSKKFISYGGGNYSSDESLVLMTFECIVNDDAINCDREVTLNIYDFSNNDFEDITYQLNTKNISITNGKVFATAISLNTSELNIKTGQTYKLVANIVPENSTDTILKWISSNEDIVSIENGCVIAKAIGSATISVYTTNNLVASCNVNVVCGHNNLTQILAKAPTCITSGNNSYYICNTCNCILDTNKEETTIDEQTLSPLGHNYIEEYDNNSHYLKCTICGEKSNIQEHSSIEDKWQIDENCHYHVCSCQTKIDIQKHIPSDIVIENKVNPTCTQTGFHDEVVYCTVCNYEISRTKIIDNKLEHISKDAVIENLKEATCSSNGSYDEVVYCKTCNKQLSRTTKIIEMLEHIPGEIVIENLDESTCDHKGSHDEVIYCTICNEQISRLNVVDNLKEHTPGQIIKENIIEPQIQVDGSYDEVTYCTKCNIELTRNTIIIPKLLYEILSGNDLTYVKGSNDSITIKANGDVSKFVELKIDDNTINKNDYSLISGSTIVTLDPQLLETLSIGNHNVLFVYDDGQIGTNLLVKQVIIEDENANNDEDEDNSQEQEEIEDENNEDINQIKQTTTNTEFTTNIVPTGDKTDIILWIIFALSSAILFILTLIAKNEKESPSNTNNLDDNK